MITVERLDLRADGVAGDLRVARSLPGERVAGVARDGRIDDPRILAPSPERVRAPCAHFRNCGGCALMHASDGFVARWKAGVVERALAGQGLSAPIHALHVSPPAARRRAVLAGRRLKRGALVGFHGRASDTITAIPDCRLLHPDLMAALPVFEALVARGAPRGRVLALHACCSEAGVDLAVSGGKTLDLGLRAALAELAGQAGIARLAWDDEVLVQAAPPVQRMGRAAVVPPPGAFLQATADGAAALVSAVRTATAGAGRVADLFAGCGTFSLPLAEVVPVHAVEGNAAMLDALAAGWRATPGLKALGCEVRDLFRRPLQGDELARFGAVVIDPPRAGASAQMAELARSPVPVVAAVSCNPVSFARDAHILVAAGFRLEWVQVVDQFRWSAHVELAARFVRGHMARG